MIYNVNMLCWSCLNEGTHRTFTINYMLMLPYSMQSNCCEPKLYGTFIDWMSKHKHFMFLLKNATFSYTQSYFHSLSWRRLDFTGLRATITAGVKQRLTANKHVFLFASSWGINWALVMEWCVVLQFGNQYGVINKNPADPARLVY